MTQDPRIPVTSLADPAGLAPALAGPSPAALLVAAPEAAAPPGGAVAQAAFASGAARHVIGCACCAGRSAAAQALDRLFQQRARGQCPWFERVIALVPGAAAQTMLAEALEQDVLTRARFRRAD